MPFHARNGKPIFVTASTPSYPIHVRRKQFFDTRQKDGQSVIEFREELLSLLEETDSVNIGCDDLICMMLQIKLSDTSLQRELGTVSNPTLAAFSERIEGFKQARWTISSSAYSNAVSRSNPSFTSSRRNPGQSGRPANCATPPRGKGERDRRLALRGKCFRCAKPDHMIPQCSYPESVKCNLCGAVGHVTPACSHCQVAQMAQHQHVSSSPSPSSAPSFQQLAIAYNGGSQFSADGTASAWPLPSSSSSIISSPTRAGVFYTPSNQPTPEMPL